MSRKILATILAAGFATLIVALVPRLDPAVANTTATNAKANCLQNWPYYERSCLHDSRQRDGSARAVRIITIDVSTADPVSGR